MKLTKLANNFTELETERYSVCFSYETPIAFAFGEDIWISKNEWGTTTGKHINTVKRVNDGKYKQIPHDELMGLIALYTA